MVNTNDKVVDKTRKITYLVGALIGKGGFARCFELYDKKVKYAGKVIPKTDVKNASTKEKLQQEIKIHSQLNHENIVKLISYFEDDKNLFIVLELCTCKSMHELLKRRKTLLLPETRYFTKQIAIACQYLHDNLIIHRDLKLANVLLDKDLCVKLADFGLATQLNSEIEKKKTMCGTPNYIAPEILTKCGHSFEVDVWSLGVIIFTVIFGKPPFETENLQTTYKLIKSNQYTLPHNIDDDVHNIITSCLNSDANSRPTMKSLLDMDFFKKPIPTCLPTSVLSCAPRFDYLDNNGKDINKILHGLKIDDNQNVKITTENKDLLSIETQIAELLLKETIANSKDQPKLSVEPMAECEDPKLAPVFWVTKWVDYTDRYGLGYQLNDNSTAVLFNDETLMVITANNINMQYIEKSGSEHLFTKDSFPQALNKKVTLIDYFQNYMNQNLATAGGEAVNKEKESMVRLPYMVKFFRNKIAIVLYLSNGTLQINFLQDHIKLVICPLMSSVTHIDEKNVSKTFSMAALKENGITKDFSTRLTFVSKIIRRLMKSI